MIRKLRLAILIVVPCLFWLMAIAFPEAMQEQHLRFLSAIFTGVWAIVGLFLTRLSGLTNLESLPSNQLDLLQMRLANTRKRMWWMVGVSVACSLSIWVLSSPNLIANVELRALAIGFLFSVCVSYMVIFLFWTDDLQNFQDSLKIAAAEKAKRDAELKAFAEAAKPKK